MSKRLFIIIALSLMGVLLGYSQKKEISQAKTNLKNNTNLSQVEESMNNLLKDSVNHKNNKIWFILFDAIKKQYDQGNEQLYLKQAYDTATLFKNIRRLFIAMERFDSVDAEPNEKGKVAPKYRKKNSRFLNVYRQNIYSGGIYFTQKKDFSQAFDFFDAYIDCADQPLFTNQHYSKTDTLLPNAAYMTVYCGYKLGNADKIMKYSELAMADTSKHVMLYQYISEAYKQRKDTSMYEATLLKGFEKQPTSNHFFPCLFDLYINRKDLARAMAITDKALAVDSTSLLFNYAKSTILLHLRRYDECIDICDNLIMQNDSLSEAYYNAGLAYFNQTIDIEKNMTTSRRQLPSKLQMLYKSAMPYMERYRVLAPDRKDRWGKLLYTIYLNLNMGKEFEEIDALLKTDESE